MQKVLTAAEMREVDRLTTEKYGIPSILLMENAAHAVARVITEKLGGSVDGKSILVLCGPGNNGGDGAALARVLCSQGFLVEVYFFTKIDSYKFDARINVDVLTKTNTVRYWEEVPIVAAWPQTPGLDIGSYDAIVDALFGTGISRPLNDEFRNVFDAIKQSMVFTVAVDIPSGLSEELNVTENIHAGADVTVSFTSPKPANVLPALAGFNGDLIIANIGSPQILIDEQASQFYLAAKDDAVKWLGSTSFSCDSYKNKRGHTLLVAGSESYSGAAVLAADAAMRSGVGLVTVVTPRSSKESIASRALPEVMVKGVAETESGAVAEEAFDELTELLGKANAVAVGSGLSQSESTHRFVQKLVEKRTQPMVLDADALNLLSPFVVHVDTSGTLALQSPLILTPHEGEFMRLLGAEDKNALKDRVAVVREFSQKHGVILVLKGERVLIGEPGGKVVVNPTGNSGLGKAGNGDTLTGVLAGFVAQAAKMNIDVFETVVAAVYVAGMAGDVAEKKFGKRVMTASDVRECLVEVFTSLSEKQK